MVLEINEPVVLAQKQRPKLDGVLISGLSTPKNKQTELVYVMYNENDQPIAGPNGVRRILKTGAEHNEFWTDFNDGKVPYEELGFLRANIPDSVESDYLNDLTPEPQDNENPI